ncbi:MAG: hypothetical protein EA351_15020, partial [Gemmatimonadales bacterium]
MTYGWGQSGNESLWDRMCVRERPPEGDIRPEPDSPPTREELMNDPEELEALEALGDEIAVLSAHESVLEYERMAKIAVFDRR